MLTVYLQSKVYWRLTFGCACGHAGNNAHVEAKYTSMVGIIVMLIATKATPQLDKPYWPM